MIDSCEIKKAISIKRLMAFYGIDIINNRCICPFHGGKSATMSIKDNRAKCFSCGKSIDIFGFVSDFFNLTFQESILKINNDFNLGYKNNNTYKENIQINEIIKKRKVKIEKKKQIILLYKKDKSIWIDRVRYISYWFGVDELGNYMSFKAWYRMKKDFLKPKIRRFM